MKAIKYLVGYLRETRAVAAMEYAIIVGVIVVGVSTAVVAFQGNITTFLNAVDDDITTTTLTP